MPEEAPSGTEAFFSAYKDSPTQTERVGGGVFATQGFVFRGEAMMVIDIGGSLSPSSPGEAEASADAFFCPPWGKRRLSWLSCTGSLRKYGHSFLLETVLFLNSFVMKPLPIPRRSWGSLPSWCATRNFSFPFGNDLRE